MENKERFKIYADQLIEGKVEKLEETYDPAFLAVEEPLLIFNEPVEVKGEVYRVDDELIFHLDIGTKALLPCKVCGEDVAVAIELKGHYETVPKEEWSGGIFLMDELLRQAILLETPFYAECQGGCPRREELKAYFKQNKEAAEKKSKRPVSSAIEEGVETQNPFKNLSASDFE